jgi:tripartite-type tricarboxylate transporter receptor subunit TctC
MKRRHLAQALLAGCITAPAARAQERFPERPIRVLIGFTAGGPTDVMARRVGERLTTLLGQPIIVENKTGASGTIAAAEVARARPDGHTLLVAVSSSHAIAPSLMRRVPFDPVRDFAGVTVVGSVPMAVAVNPSFPARSLPELVAAIREAPAGHFAYGTSGAGGIAHFTGELFMREVPGSRLNAVHYRGASAALQDLLANNVPIVMDTMASLAEPYRAGQIRVLATFAEARSAALPEVPTARELGIPGLIANTYNAIIAPAATPPVVLATLNRAVLQVLAEPAIQAFLQANLIDPFPDPTPARTMGFIADELAKWRPIIQATGMVME